MRASVIGEVFQLGMLGYLACLVCEGLVDMMDALEMGETIELRISLSFSAFLFFGFLDIFGIYRVG